MDTFDLANRVSALEAQLKAMPSFSPPLNKLAQNEDVLIGGPEGDTPLTDGDVITYVAADLAFENKPASAGSGFPVGPYDDGTTTYEITAAGGALIVIATNNASGATSRTLLAPAFSGFPIAAIVGIDGSGNGAEMLAGSIGGLSQGVINIDGTQTFQQTKDNATFVAINDIALNLETTDGAAGVGVYNGDPNGVVTALAGSVLLDSTPGRPWYNTDGATAWTQLT